MGAALAVLPGLSCTGTAAGSTGSRAVRRCWPRRRCSGWRTGRQAARNTLVIRGNGSETWAAYAPGDGGDAFLARWTLHTRVVAGCSSNAVVRSAADLAREEDVREQAPFEPRRPGRCLPLAARRESSWPGRSS